MSGRTRPVMLFDVRGLTETRRRLVTMGAGFVLVAGAIWLMLQVVEDAAGDERPELWQRFIVGALVVAVPASVLLWRKLSKPPPGGHRFDQRRYFWPMLALGVIFRRQIGDSLELTSLVAGASAGMFLGLMVVYLYDLMTNNLSDGRSWHYPEDPEQRLYPSSKTSSPT